MQPTYTADAEAYRTTIQAFLAEHLPSGWRGIGALDPDAADAFCEQWRTTLGSHGLLAPSWPREYGGAGLSHLEQVILAEELQRAGAPNGIVTDLFSIQMIGNTLLRWGTEDQKAHFIPRILSGEDRWCQGYSEPDAGSDLGSIATRAVLDGDEWIIDGQKIWTSAAHRANWIFVLTRTDPGAPKHKGITFLLCPLEQPGIEIRPIAMPTGEPEFNEVFFTGARCPRGNVVGEVDRGWPVAMTLLGYERGEAAATFPIRFRTDLDRLTELAVTTGRSRDPLVRDRLAQCHAEVETMRYLGLRTLTASLAGRTPGPDAAVMKLYWSELYQRMTALAVDILGPEATVPSGAPPRTTFEIGDPGSPNDSASWVGAFINARAATIYAGSSEIQRNIIGEMLLGLPKEPAPTAS
jgi:hypothetical protein